MALINRPSYGELMENRSIDIVISPQTITIGSLLAHVRRGDVVRVHSLRRGVGRGDRGGGARPGGRSRVIGRQIERDRAAAGRQHRRDRARRAGDHGAPRHAHRSRGPRHHVPVRPPPHRRGLAPVPGRALSSPKNHALALWRRTSLGSLLALFSRCTCCRSSPRWCSTSARSCAFVEGAVLCLAAGVLVRALTLRYRTDLKPRDAYLLVTLELAGADGRGHHAADDADAGLELHARVLRDPCRACRPPAPRCCPDSTRCRTRSICGAPRLSWLGGMGIIVLAVAILPLLGVGGMQLYRAETPGPGQGCASSRRASPRPRSSCGSSTPA